MNLSSKINFHEKLRCFSFSVVIIIYIRNKVFYIDKSIGRSFSIGNQSVGV